MNELESILQAWRGLSEERADAVLATVVHVTGSAYRRPGARMLVLPDGRRIGTVSGGCLEGEIAKKSRWFIGDAHAALRVYDTTSDEAAAWEFGLGCNGVVHVLLEKLQQAEAALRFIEQKRQKREGCVVATVIRTGDREDICLADRLFLDEKEICGGSLKAPDLQNAIANLAGAAFETRRSRLLRMDAVEIFVEWIGPVPSLVVFGAGHDVQPLVAMAGELGWEITVADGRPAYARAERFPGARKVVVAKSGSLFEGIGIERDSAVLLMTHNYPLDRILLPGVLARRPHFIGILGPKARTERLFSELEVTPPASVHAPVGLDIGSDSPSAVALAILAEIQAAWSHREGGMLRCRKEPIHAPAIEEGVACGVPQDERTRPEYCESMSGEYA